MRPARNPSVTPMVGDVWERRGGMKKEYEVVSFDGALVGFRIEGCIGQLTLPLVFWAALIGKGKCIRRGDGARL